MHKFCSIIHAEKRKVWAGFLLLSEGKRTILRFGQKEAKSMIMDDFRSGAVFELAREPFFPNLMNDRDVISYNWTLPFFSR